MTLPDLIAEVRAALTPLAPVYRYLEQGKAKLPYFTWEPISTTASYSISCVGSIGDTELVQLDIWARTFLAAHELEAQVLAVLEPLGYTLGSPTRTIREPENNLERRALTLRRRI